MTCPRLSFLKIAFFIEANGAADSILHLNHDLS